MAGEVSQAGRINPIGFAHRSPYSSAADVAATYVAKLAWRLCTAFPVRINPFPWRATFFSPRPEAHQVFCLLEKAGKAVLALPAWMDLARSGEVVKDEP